MSDFYPEMWELFRKARVRLGFDPSWYLTAYPDVREQVEKGYFRKAFDHYWQFGSSEGRLPAEPDFDEEWYLRINADVRAMVNRGEYANGLDHFARHGFREGRRGVPVYRQFSLIAPSSGRPSSTESDPAPTKSADTQD